MKEFEIDGVTHLEIEKNVYRVFIKNPYKYLSGKYKQVIATAFDSNLTDAQKVQQIKKICISTYIKLE